MLQLGIKVLSQVRVKNLQELVYKQGQAGVTKASVTIIFDNSDEKTSPIGFEKHRELQVTRQIIIGGRDKYLINGHLARQAQVANLFHSVGLNVNNPHFLIMQGRITKVLNMKPPETLSMVEEAAGTRMFENKKQQSLKVLRNKEAKEVRNAKRHREAAKNFERHRETARDTEFGRWQHSAARSATSSPHGTRSHTAPTPLPHRPAPKFHSVLLVLYAYPPPHLYLCTNHLPPSTPVYPRLPPSTLGGDPPHP